MPPYVSPEIEPEMELPQSTAARVPRLGRVERAIMAALSHNGSLTPRDQALAAAFPDVGTERASSPPPERAVRRARAEAALSRAIFSLERKGLITRDRNAYTGRTYLRAAGDQSTPTWEQLARAEEDLAAHCQQISRRWAELSRRARQRAARIRVERSDESSEEGRRQDLEGLARLETPGG